MKDRRLKLFVNIAINIEHNQVENIRDGLTAFRQVFSYFYFIFRLKKNGEVMKGQYKYIKLNNNRKTISVGDWTNDKTSPSTEDLEPRIQVSLKCNSSLLHRIINSFPWI